MAVAGQGGGCGNGGDGGGDGEGGNSGSAILGCVSRRERERVMAFQK